MKEAAAHQQRGCQQLRCRVLMEGANTASRADRWSGSIGGGGGGDGGAFLSVEVKASRFEHQLPVDERSKHISSGGIGVRSVGCWALMEGAAAASASMEIEAAAEQHQWRQMMVAAAASGWQQWRWMMVAAAVDCLNSNERGGSGSGNITGCNLSIWGRVTWYIRIYTSVSVHTSVYTSLPKFYLTWKAGHENRIYTNLARVKSTFCIFDITWQLKSTLRESQF